MAQTIGEPDARPNDAVRAELLAVLDIADRAGVQLSAITAYCYGGRVSAVDVHGSRPDGHRMAHTDALRIALRAARRTGDVEVSDPITHTDSRPYVTMRVDLEAGGPRLTLYVEPSPAQLADLLIDAVLQS